MTSVSGSAALSGNSNSASWRITRATVLLSLLVAASTAAFASALNERIAVSSTAAPDYHREIPGQPGVRPESYIFMQGQFFGSATRDRGLESTTFTALTQTLAKDLAKQEYYPTKDVNSADLVIIVYWGSSLVYDDPQKDTNIDRLNDALTTFNQQIKEGGIADTGPINSVSDSMSSAAGNSEQAMQRNAALMGYTRALRKSGQGSTFMSEEEKTLRLELSEERYLVVLMAYDFQELKKKKIRHLRWVTRLSVRSPGNNFASALPVLSQAGSHVFGHDIKDLVHVKANLREAVISLGDLKVLETIETSPPAKP